MSNMKFGSSRKMVDIFRNVSTKCTEQAKYVPFTLQAKYILLLYKFHIYGIYIMLRNVKSDIRAIWIEQDNVVSMVNIFRKVTMKGIKQAKYIPLTLQVPCIQNLYNAPQCQI